MKRDRVEKNTPTKKRVCQKDLETKKSLYRFMWAMTEKDIKKRIKEKEVTGGERYTRGHEERNSEPSG